jgi:phospho-N-acetylmuramoyl-pentapeptide-transferase
MGLTKSCKFILQTAVALAGVAAILIVSSQNNVSQLLMPFFKDIVIDLRWFYPIYDLFIIVGASNSTNLTDGLDGLLIMPIAISFSAYAVLSYIAGNLIYANYLSVFYIRGASELTIFCGAVVGSALGFLWWNAYPATIFMGDTGSLPLGAALGMVALIVKQELMLAIIGAVFVVEALSVILQIGYFKFSNGKRIFLMAPLHHDLELRHWSETKITVRFWIISLILTIVAMSTLKLR